jgi:hypothetical protein
MEEKVEDAKGESPRPAKPWFAANVGELGRCGLWGRGRYFEIVLTQISINANQLLNLESKEDINFASLPSCARSGSIP